VDNLAQADESVQKSVLARSIKLWGADRLGLSNPQAWTNMNDLLVKMGLLATPLDVSQAFTNEFVP
jgi:NitT/TauT family transport system substrate-binding protein